MNNKQFGNLLTFDIVEPNDAELQQFKDNFLYKRNNTYVARKAKQHIELLEKHIIALYNRFEHIDKLTKEEYIDFCKQLQENRINHSEEIKQLQNALENHKNKIERLKKQIRERDDLIERYRKSKLNGE